MWHYILNFATVYKLKLIFLSQYNNKLLKSSKMGVYLSEPNKDKKIKEGHKKGVSFCLAEMQGILSFI